MAPATMLARKRARSSVSTSLADSGPETFEDAFARYNKSGTGELAPDELREFLQDGCDTGDGMEMTDDELAFVLTVADKGRTGALSMTELPTALAKWGVYVDLRPRIKRLFAQYAPPVGAGAGAASRADRLDREQLRCLLSEGLNEGNAVPDAVLDTVFRFADVVKDGTISHPELSLAVAKWYAIQSEGGGSGLTKALAVLKSWRGSVASRLKTAASPNASRDKRTVRRP